MKQALVRNLTTLETRLYTCAPKEAVICAYAQALGDLNTWDYEARYGHLRRETRLCYNIGDWACFKDGREKM